MTQADQWPAKPQRDYGKPVEVNVFTAHFGPHLCPSCHGVGWHCGPFPKEDWKPRELVKCGECDAADIALVANLWEVSRLDPNDPEPPSFANYRLRDDTMQTMLQAAQMFAANPRGWLTFYGQSQGRKERRDGRWGSGKSHLAEAIARALLSRKVATLRMSASRLFAYLGAGYRQPGDDIDYARRVEWVMRLPVLIVDELNKEISSEATDRRRSELFEARYQAAIRGTGGATVLISNDHPDAWQDPAIASRAMDTRFVSVEASAVDFRRVKRT